MSWIPHFLMSFATFWNTKVTATLEFFAINDLAVSARSGRSNSEFYVCLSVDTWYLKIQVQSRRNVFHHYSLHQYNLKKLQFISARSGWNCQIPYHEKLEWRCWYDCNNFMAITYTTYVIEFSCQPLIRTGNPV